MLAFLLAVLVAAPTEKTITADFVDAPVEKALLQIAEAEGLSLVLPGGKHGTVSAHFKDTPAEDALHAVLKQAGLSATKEGSVLSVKAETDESDTEDTDDEKGGVNVTIHRGDFKVQSTAHDRVITGDVTVDPGESARDVVALRGHVLLEPNAHAREVVALFGGVDLAPGATVERGVVAIGGDIHVAPGARIGREAVSIGGRIRVDRGGIIEREQTSIGVPGLASLLGGLAGGAMGFGAAASPLFWMGSAFAQFALLFALGLILLVLRPQRLESVADTLHNAPAASALTGLVGFLLLPVITVLLGISIVGIPLILVVVLIVLLAGVQGFAGLALAVGRRIPLGHAPIVHLAVGSALIVALAQVPFFGKLALLTAWVVVFGAWLRSRSRRHSVEPTTVVVS